MKKKQYMVYAHNGSALFGTLLVRTSSRRAAINKLKKTIRFRVVVFDREFPLTEIKPINANNRA